jgi:Fic family protein
MLFQTPSLEPREAEVIGEIEAIRKEFAAPLPKVRDWPGLPWRGIQARLAGRTDESDEAQAAGEHYRAALSFVLQLADVPEFRYDEGVFRALHYLMVGAQPAKNPGRWRRGAMLVARPARFADLVDYRAPDFRQVPALLRELIAWLNSPDGAPALVRAAMAHLNLAAIHPFLDANGRMARALHTLVLAREGLWLPAFSSIDEYVASKSGAYVKALQQTHGGAWHPERDARPWVRYCLTAHLRQARRLAERSRAYDRLWDELEREAARRALPERTIAALVHAAMGEPVTTEDYGSLLEVPVAAASEDLERLIEARLLAQTSTPEVFDASPELQAIAARCCAPEEPERDPFAAGASAPAS